MFKFHIVKVENSFTLKFDSRYELVPKVVKMANSPNCTRTKSLYPYGTKTRKQEHPIHLIIGKQTKLILIQHIKIATHKLNGSEVRMRGEKCTIPFFVICTKTF